MEMSSGIIIHLVLGASALCGGYYGIKKNNRELALFAAGAQPSIAIAMSLADLSVTFGNMQSALESDDIFGAMSIKMIHMTFGIGAGLVQELFTLRIMPASLEQEKNAETLRSSVIEGISSKVEEFNSTMKQINASIQTVPTKVYNNNAQMIERYNNVSNEMLSKSNENLVNHTKHVEQVIIESGDNFVESANSMKSAMVQINKSVQNVPNEISKNNAQMIERYNNVSNEMLSKSNENLSGHAKHVESLITENHNKFVESFDSMKSDLNDVNSAFGDKLRGELEPIVKMAATKGSEIIEEAGRQIAEKLNKTVANTLASAANLEKSANEVERISKALVKNAESQ